MCTLEKRGSIYFLTLTGPDEHRLNPTLLDSIHSALRTLRETATTSSPCSALVTAAEGKFFCNGFDLEWARSAPSRREGLSRMELMIAKLREIVLELMSLPMPTIAAVTGHVAAGGMPFALAHDHVAMRRDRGFMYMSEMDIGMAVPRWFAAVFEGRVGNLRVVREMILSAPKLTAEAAIERGIVDVAGEGVEGTVAAAVEIAERLVGRGWVGHVYASNRMTVMGDVFEKVQRFGGTRGSDEGKKEEDLIETTCNA